MTNRLSAWVIHLLEDVRSFSSVAREVNLSVSTVIRIFDVVGYSQPQSQPEVLAIDEFKGNTGDEKYQCILTDRKTGVVLDILPNRITEYLIKYFKQWDLDKRKTVRYFVSDMWQPYTDLAAALFKNSKRILTKRAEKLQDYQKERVNAIFYISDNLRIACELKEKFYEIVDAKDRKQARDLMSEWIYDAQSSGLNEYVKCSNTMINRHTKFI